MIPCLIPLFISSRRWQSTQCGLHNTYRPVTHPYPPRADRAQRPFLIFAFATCPVVLIYHIWQCKKSAKLIQGGQKGSVNRDRNLFSAKVLSEWRGGCQSLVKAAHQGHAGGPGSDWIGFTQAFGRRKSGNDKTWADRNCFIFNYLLTLVERPFFTIVFCGSDWAVKSVEAGYELDMG